MASPKPPKSPPLKPSGDSVDSKKDSLRDTATEHANSAAFFIKKNGALRSWGLWTFCLLLPFSLFLSPHILTGILNDGSLLSLCIMLLFLIGFGLALIQTLLINREHNSLFSMISTKSIDSQDSSNISKLVRKIEARSSAKGTVDLPNILDAYSSSLISLNTLVRTLSTVLVTVGLLGTIIGLIDAIGGLDVVVQSVGDTERMNAAMQETIGGMWTAFYTTLIGAFFGGVFLKILSSITTSSVGRIRNAAFSFISLEIDLFDGVGETARILREIQESLGK